MKTLYHRRDFTYPKPSHAKSALAVFVATRPNVSIIGKVPEKAIDIKRERNALMLMLAMRYHKNKVYRLVRSGRLSASRMHQVNEISNRRTEYNIDLVSPRISTKSDIGEAIENPPPVRLKTSTQGLEPNPKFRGHTRSIIQK